MELSGREKQPVAPVLGNQCWTETILSAHGSPGCWGNGGAVDVDVSATMNVLLWRL